MAKKKSVVLDPIEQMPTEPNEDFVEVGVVEEPLVEVKVDTEEDKKQRYEAYLVQNAEQISALVSSYANMFAGMGNGSLAELATGSDLSSISRNPKLADALLFELGKRKLKKEADILINKLADMPWYTTPWVGF